MKYLQSYNESIRDFLKPKSEEEIVNSTENLTPYQKFYKGCLFGYLPLVKQGVESGIDPSIEGNIGIKLSSEKGYIDVVKYLLTFKKVDPTVSNYEPIVKSAKNNHGETLEILLNTSKVDYDISEYNYYLINYCALNKKYKSLKVLLNYVKKWTPTLIKYNKELEEYENNL